jgi:hypothetical protein
MDLLAEHITSMFSVQFYAKLGLFLDPEDAGDTFL